MQLQRRRCFFGDCQWIEKRSDRAQKGDRAGSIEIDRFDSSVGVDALGTIDRRFNLDSPSTPKLGSISGRSKRFYFRSSYAPRQNDRRNYGEFVRVRARSIARTGAIWIG